MLQMLAVDKNVTVFERRTGGWAKYGVAPQRVDSMREAIYRLIQGEKFYFIVINEDTVPEFMPLLPIMRDVTEAPIFVLTSNYTVEKRTAALKNGADVYDPIHAQPRLNILSMLEVLKRWTDRTLHLKVRIGGEIILSQPRRKAFFEGREISLSKTEFAILHYLMANKGRVMTHEQILKEAWDKYIESDVGVLWRAVNRLRNKLPAPANEYIKIVRGVGYVFAP